MANGDEAATRDWVVKGERDRQTVADDWLPVEAPPIAGVEIKEIRPVACPTGYVTEIWRREWHVDDLPFDQFSSAHWSPVKSRVGTRMH